ncbi:MAG TPA: YggS family pyridoxal phosphate-dependent enzyme [Candidatus Binataceae bacterium]|nr:YggS family pyridoxal phosphate-dependent enzyme [Candidatus Binataceae bacterium]
MLSAGEIADRLAAVRARVAAAARRSDREPAAITIVLAAKTQPPGAIRAAYDAGARDFGENYVQEAAAKRAALGKLGGARWHLIGHLQTNKARLAASLFDLIHSVDSARLAAALGAVHAAPPVRVLLEVNLAGEATKSGAAPGDLEALIAEARERVEIAGLMTIPPPGDTPESARRYFTELRIVRDRLAVHSGLALSELSMGMTDDFEIAIEEGATIVRVGRAIFGERSR